MEIVNKNSNRTILKELRRVYPQGLTAQKLASNTDLPEKTIYAQLKELYDNYFIQEEEKAARKKGRPSMKQVEERATKYIVEDASNINNQEQQLQFAPGNVDYSSHFLEAWHELVDDKEVDEMSSHLMNFVSRTYRRTRDSSKKQIREIAPATENFICSSCGVNHEARDFIRAVLLHLMDHLEKTYRFAEFMKKNELIAEHTYRELIKSIESTGEEEEQEQEQEEDGF
jgi:hypothetical protein